MLPKSERLKERYLFNKAFRVRQKFSSKILTLYYLYSANDINNLKNKFPKTAFIVGLTVDKKSVKRNLIKRRMRSAYLSLKKGISYSDKTTKRIYIISALIWIANPEANKVSYIEIRDTMKSLLDKLELNWIKYINNDKQNINRKTGK